MILVTGGAGFIGSNFIIDWFACHDEPILNVDCLSYAGNLANLNPLTGDARHVFVKADIADSVAMTSLLQQHRPRAIINFAAQSHVDRSIDNPAPFITTNITGTFNLLEAARNYWERLPTPEKTAFRLVQISSDEVYGALALNKAPVEETQAYAPNNPYAASKAAADHLVHSYWHTYELPTITTISTNNYGPCQFPEKLIPLMILNALAGKPLPIYGDGLQQRDWIHVSDHCAAIRRVVAQGEPGESYHIGVHNEHSNLAIVHQLCDVLDELIPNESDRSYRDHITFVSDRPGHDRRYAIDASKIKRELGWQAQQPFDAGLRSTVQWYLDNPQWISALQSREQQ